MRGTPSWGWVDGVLLGHYYDTETGAYYNYFRDLDPRIGRYVESDPIGLDGGPNTYGYVSNGPLNASDPFGLDPVGQTIGQAVGLWGGRFVGGAIGSAIEPGGGTALGAILGGAIGSRAGGAIGSAIGNICLTQNNQPNDCESLYREIDRLVNQLQRRDRQIRENKGSLSATGPNSVDSHQGKFEDRQRELRKRLNAANSRGCTAYRNDAWYWATRDATEPRS
jgi:RHS repeat-associated protein